MKSSTNKPFFGIDLGKPGKDKTVTFRHSGPGGLDAGKIDPDKVYSFINGELREIKPRFCKDCGYPSGLVTECYVCQLKKCYIVCNSSCGLKKRKDKHVSN